MLVTDYFKDYNRKVPVRKSKLKMYAGIVKALVGHFHSVEK